MNLGVIRGNEASLEVLLNYRYPVTKNFEDCNPAVRKQFEDAGFAQAALAHRRACTCLPTALWYRNFLRFTPAAPVSPESPNASAAEPTPKCSPMSLPLASIFPGDEVREHKADEFMEISRLIDNAEIIAEAMYALAAD